MKKEKAVCDLIEGVADVAVPLEEVEDGLAEDLEGEAHVPEVVEAVEHPHTQVLPGGVLWGENILKIFFFT